MDAHYDIVVAGGGPAGLSAAQVAATHGLQVLVAEKHAEIGSPTRTSGASFVADMVALQVPPHLYHPVVHCRLFGPSTEAIFSPKTTVACIVNVRGLYQYLAEQAIGAGATLSPRTQVIDVIRHSGAIQGVRVRDHAGQLKDVCCRLVIDATGFSSTLAVKAGMHAPYRRMGVGAEYDLYAPSFPEDTVAIAFGSTIAPAGYAWAFPYGHHRVRAGVGVLRPDVTANPVDYLDAFIQSYQPLRDAFAGASPVEFHTGVIPAEGLNKDLVADGIMTAGDAAGQPSALFGEGIRFAMYAGRLAGQVGANAVSKGDVSASALMPYDQEWRRRFGGSLRIAYALNRRAFRTPDERWDEIIRAMQGLDPAVYTRLLATDLSFSLGLRIMLHSPRLLGIVVRTVARDLVAQAGSRAGTTSA